MAKKYEVTIKFLVDDDLSEGDLNQFLGELQAPADDPSVDVFVYSVVVRSVDDRGRTVEVDTPADRQTELLRVIMEQAHGRVIPAELA